MATIEKIPEGTAQTLINVLGYDVLRYFIDIKTAIDTSDSDKMDVIDSPTVDNIVTVDADGNAQDSGYDLPGGSVVGTTDTQTLTNKILTTPTIADLTNMTHDHTSAAEGGDEDWADMAKAATQADAAASESHAITDPLDAPADADALREDLVDNVIPSIESALNALGAEFNTKFNALIDKLQTANLMS